MQKPLPRLGFLEGQQLKRGRDLARIRDYRDTEKKSGSRRRERKEPRGCQEGPKSQRGKPRVQKEYICAR